MAPPKRLVIWNICQRQQNSRPLTTQAHPHIEQYLSLSSIPTVENCFVYSLIRESCIHESFNINWTPSISFAKQHLAVVFPFDELGHKINPELNTNVSTMPPSHVWIRGGPLLVFDLALRKRKRRKFNRYASVSNVSQEMFKFFFLPYDQLAWLWLWIERYSFFATHTLFLGKVILAISFLCANKLSSQRGSEKFYHFTDRKWMSRYNWLAFAEMSFDVNFTDCDTKSLYTFTSPNDVN